MPLDPRVMRRALDWRFFRRRSPALFRIRRLSLSSM